MSDQPTSYFGSSGDTSIPPQPDSTTGDGPPTFQMQSSDSSPPQQIGPYHILGPLGEGGMGEVFKAERRGSLRQTVAIKIIKFGFASREVIARFESERQALARMDHPHVARVLDAGTVESGRPYFVMEYVPGMPITDFADSNKLSIEDRLKLFVQACEAIAHAHTKALIHRDIKSANVLAFMHDGEPSVKVIDFGIAKALTGDRLTDATFNTGHGQVIGTYDSMSPEQADSSPDIDTRTDVYSLGVLLYELLTGFRPFDRKQLAKSGDQEIRRIIRNVEPPRPSTRLSHHDDDAKTFAEARQTKPQQLTSQLKRELEWIPLKAMRKERSRRYASPLQLAEDIQNYLDGKPLIAGPESRAYRARKFLGRNPIGFTMTALSIAVIGGGTALYIRDIRAEQLKTQAALVEAEFQREQAKKHEQEAIGMASIAEALRRRQNDILASADPNAIKVAIQELDSGSLKDQPIEEAAERNTIGVTLTKSGRYDEALPVLRRALEIRQRELPAAHPDIAQSLTNLASLLQSQGNLIAAEPLFTQALEIYRKASPPRPTDVALCLNNLALVKQAQNQFDAAEPLYREALDLRRQSLPAGHPAIAQSLNNLAFLNQAQGKLSDAEPRYREALQIYRASLPPNHPDIANALNNLASVMQARSELEPAESLYREALQIYRNALPSGHVDIAQALNNLALALQAQNKLAEAETLAREGLEINRAALPLGHVNVINSASTLGRILAAEAKYSDAEPLLREAVTARMKTLGPRAAPTVRSASALADVLDATNRKPDAAALRGQCGIVTPAH